MEKRIHALKCPFCAKEMSQTIGSTLDYQSIESSTKQETLYYCEKHGVMNKSTDLREKVDQIARKA